MNDELKRQLLEYLQSGGENEIETRGEVSDDVENLAEARADETTEILTEAVDPPPPSQTAEFEAGGESVMADVEVPAVGIPATPEIVGHNYDERIATLQNEIAQLRVQCDSHNVQLANIMTQLNILESVTDDIVSLDTVDLLTNSLNRLI